MARVSLILPTPHPDTASASATVRDGRGALEAAGHVVDVLVVIGPTDPVPALDALGPEAQCLRAETPGAAAAAVAGLEQALGELLLVLDPARGYPPAEIVAVVDALASGRAEVVVASRFLPASGRVRGAIGAGFLALIGSTDPLSGLIGLDRSVLANASGFHAVGSKFALELLAKLVSRSRHRRQGARPPLDLPSRPRRGLASMRLHLGWDDIRHLKRLADHRFGNLSRLIQFCVVGASGAIVDLATYAAAHGVLNRTALYDRPAPLVGGPLSLAIAGLIAVSVAVVWNFSLNRRLTFNDARGGSLVRQFLTYLLSNAVSVPLSLFLRLRLPQSIPFFAAHRLAAAVVGIVAGTAISFSMSRWLVFRQRPAAATAPEPATATAQPHPSADSHTVTSR